MDTLNSNWITESHIDFEYKKYMLLGYLQHVNEKFSATELFPHLSSIIEHYKNLKLLQENTLKLRSNFPEALTGIDAAEFKLMHESIMNDDSIMSEIEQIVNFSIPQFEKYMFEGRKIYDFVEHKLIISPVGLTPIRVNEGYLFLRNGGEKATHIYNYQITLFERHDERYRGIHTHYVCSYEVSITNTFEQLKIELLKSHKQLPNPATFAIESSLALPMESTLLPIAKRILIRHLQETI
nr:hypothetical protein [Bacteroidota bacterium]